MEHRAGAARAHDREVQARLRRGPAASTDGPALAVDFQDLRRPQPPLVRPAGRDRQPERLPAHHHAEVPARAEDPAAVMGLPPELGDAPGQILERPGSHPAIVGGRGEKSSGAMPPYYRPPAVLPA